MNAVWWRTAVKNFEKFSEMLLHYPYYNAVETRGPGKILFSRKSGLKIARFPKIALLNDQKKIFSNQNIKCSKSFNSQSYLVKIDFWAPFCIFAYYRGVRVLENFSTKKFFFQTKISNAQNRSIRKVIYLKSIFDHLKVRKDRVSFAR